MKFPLLAFSCLCLGHLGWSQTTTSGPPKQYWLDGFSRTWFTSDALLGNEVNPSRISSGWNLFDLNPHVNPVQGVEVFAQIRVLNEFGGFFGQGTQVDVRQLRVSGVLQNKVKFNLGDVYLNQSEFTLHADEGEVSDPWGTLLPRSVNWWLTRIFFKEIVGDCKGPMPMPRSKETVG